jgi:hypothetical protein
MHKHTEFYLKKGRIEYSVFSLCRDQECVELELHSQYAFMAWCSVKVKAQGQLYPIFFRVQLHYCIKLIDIDSV